MAASVLLFLPCLLLRQFPRLQTPVKIVLGYCAASLNPDLGVYLSGNRCRQPTLAPSQQPERAKSEFRAKFESRAKPLLTGHVGRDAAKPAAIIPFTAIFAFGSW